MSEISPSKLLAEYQKAKGLKGPCWMLYRDKPKPLKHLKQIQCPKNLICIDTIANIFGPNYPTKEGLMSDLNPIGLDKAIEWLWNNCPHPKKKEIVAHWVKMGDSEIHGVVIPWNLVKKMDKMVEGLENE